MLQSAKSYSPMKQPTPLPTDISSVRLAEQEDEDDLLAMLREMHKESGLRTRANEPLPFSERKVRSAIQDATRRNPQRPDIALAWAGIIGDRGQIHGSLCIVVTEPWYSESSHLSEKWNFIYPEYRKSNAARTLLAFAKAVSDQLHDLDPLFMGVNSSEQHEVKRRLYERVLGCKAIASGFQYNPANDSAAGA